MSPLRQSMVDAMTVRGLSVRTIGCYTESIGRLSRHHGGQLPPATSRPAGGAIGGQNSAGTVEERLDG